MPFVPILVELLSMLSIGVGAYSTHKAIKAEEALKMQGLTPEEIDERTTNIFGFNLTKVAKVLKPILIALIVLQGIKLIRDFKQPK